MSVEASKETLEFQTEARQILHLMTHSLYSNKEIFLRELISNASDACDKLRFDALGNDSLYEGDSELSIHVAYDDAAKTVTITELVFIRVLSLQTKLLWKPEEQVMMLMKAFVGSPMVAAVSHWKISAEINVVLPLFCT